MSPDFFAATDDEMVTFASTAIEVTGEKTAKITGDLTLNGVTKPVVLDAVLNQVGDHPMARQALGRVFGHHDAFCAATSAWACSRPSFRMTSRLRSASRR